MNTDHIRILREKQRELERASAWSMQADTECCGITVSQCHTLLEIGRKKEVSIVDLAAAMDLDTSTLSRTINGMVNIGLVDRVLNANDRRYVTISLTERGNALYDMIEGIYNDYYARVFALIPEDKHAQIVESFVLLADAVRKMKDVRKGCACSCAGEEDVK